MTSLHELGVAAVAAAVACIAPTSSAQCMYDLVVLEELPEWTGVHPEDMAEDGTVVGFFGKESGLQVLAHAFRWHESTGYVQLPQPPGIVEAEAFLINKAGVIAGECINSSVQIPAHDQFIIWQDGAAYSPPPTTPPGNLGVFGINSQGIVVGYYEAGPSGGESFLWIDGEFVQPAPEILNGYSQIYTITDTGWYGGAWTSFDQLEAHPFVASLEGDVIFLDTPPGHILGKISDLNEAGIGLLNARLSTTLDSRLFIWDGATTTEVPVPRGMKSIIGFGINELGQILLSVSPLPPQRGYVPCLWQSGVFTDLRTRVVLPPGLKIGGFRRILDDGRILTTGTSPGKTYGFILTPVTTDEDVNVDCSIDANDLLFVIENWGEVGPSTLPRADVDKDGVVDGYDLAMVLGAWSPTAIGR